MNSKPYKSINYEYGSANSDNSANISLELETAKLNPEYSTLLDKIHSQYGYKSELWKIILSIFLICIIDGYSGTIFATMIKAYTTQFELSNSEISLIGVIYFMVKALGGLFSGFFTKIMKGRILIVYSCLLIILSSNLLLALILEKPVLYLERILSGFFSGILEPIGNNLLCEYLPINFRGFTLLSLGIGFNLGQLFPNIIMLNTMPNFEISGIYKTLFISTLLILLCTIICFLFLKDSPRNYILKNEKEKAFKILEKICFHKRLSEKEKVQILSEVREGVNKDQNSSSFNEVFKKQFMVLTICISIISFISNLIYDGPVLIMDLTFTTLNDKQPTERILKESIVVILLCIPSSIVGGLSMENKYLGRRLTMLLSFVMIILSSFLSMIFTENIEIFLGMYQFFSNYNAGLAMIYASEVSPTKIRDFSVGLSAFFGSFGSVASQIIYIWLHDIGAFTPYIFSMGCCVLGCVVCYLLSIETYHRPLDVRTEDEISEKVVANQSNIKI